MKSILLSLSLILLLSAASAQQGPVYKMEKGKPYKYLQEIKSDISQEMMGQTMNVTVDGTVTSTLTVTEVLPDGNWKCVNKIENALVMIESPQGPQTLGNDLAGKEIGVTMKPNGEIVARDSMPAGINPQNMQIITRVQQILPKLSSQPLAVGTSWTEDQTDTTEGRGTMINKSSIKYTVAEKKAMNDYDCFLINFEGTQSTNGTVSQQGMDITISGDGTLKGTLYFAEKEGLLVQYTTESNNDQTASIPSNNMRIPMTMHMTLKTELAK